MKKFFITVVLLLTLLILSVGTWLAYAMYSSHQPGPLPQTSIILIERGMGVSAIARALEDTGVIDSALTFKVYSHIDRDPRPLKAGEYEFPQAISLAGALEMMREGKVYDRKITIPEGRTSWQIAEALKGRDDLAGDIVDIPADGTLLPETYHFVRGEDRAKILGDMKAAMDKTVTELWPGRAQDLPFSTEAEMLVLASIVEKETGVAGERARIAGVFVNRLRRGMMLQSDPTVIYAVTRGTAKIDRVLYQHLDADSPYNTYRYAGLPPGPICNPGRAAIAAVLQPETNDFLYFVADGTGGHVFARTLEEHNANVAKWRAVQRAQRAP